MKPQPGYQRRIITMSMADKYAVCFIFDGIQYQNLCREEQPDGTYNYSEKCLSQLPFNLPFIEFDQNSSTNEYPQGLVRYRGNPNQNNFPDVISAISYYWVEVLLLCLLSALLFHLCFVLLRRRSANGNSNSSRFSSPSVDDEGTISIGKLSFNPHSVLGYGSKGTCVFKGSFEGSQHCAVKRIVSQYLKLADREIDFLRSLQNPHLVRYLATEEDAQFIYIALELAEYALADLISQNLLTKFNLSKEELCRQAALGLQHLHKLDIVHRDLKPQNILISFPQKPNNQRKVMISDFGLSKYLNHLDNDNTSSAMRSYDGTLGWMAPEVVKARSEEKNLLPSKATDIFSLGCVFYYILSNGKHPFGIADYRQANILNDSNCMDFFKLDDLSEEKVVLATHLIQSMIDSSPKLRPPIGHILKYPLFWSLADQLQFLMDVSDRVEKADPRSLIVSRLERSRIKVIGFDWSVPLCEPMRQNLSKFRSYKAYKLIDLLRVIRNKRHHYNECPEYLKQSLGEVPDGLMQYFSTRFPRLLPHIYTTMQYCRDENLFKTYYEQDIVDENCEKNYDAGDSPSLSNENDDADGEQILVKSTDREFNRDHVYRNGAFRSEKENSSGFSSRDEQNFSWPSLVAFQKCDLNDSPKNASDCRKRSMDTKPQQ